MKGIVRELTPMVGLALNVIPQVSFRSLMEFGDVGVCGREKTREAGEKPSEQGKKQQQTQPIYGAWLQSNPGHIGGR